MLEIVTMLTVLRSAEVVGRSVPLTTCLAIQRAVEISVSDKSDIKYFWPDMVNDPSKAILQVSCVPLLSHTKEEPGS